MRTNIISVNHEYDIEITDITDEGMGVGRFEHQVLFVEGGLPGDYLKVRVTETKKSWAVAKVVSILRPSTHRIEPACPYAKACGGCSIMHFDYDAQLEYKEGFVLQALNRIGSQTEFVLNPILGMTFPYHYRNKGLYAFTEPLALGFYEPKSHKVVPVKACMIQHNDHGKLLDAVLNWAKLSHVSVFNTKTNKGLLRHLMIRTTTSGEHMLGLIINGHSIPNPQLLIEQICAANAQVKSIMLNIQQNTGNTILGKDFVTLYGTDILVDHIGPLAFELSMGAFFQVNPQQTLALYQKAIDYCDLKGHEIVWDLYSGAGTIALSLAAHAKHVYGNELVDQAVQNARANAQLNGIKNVTFIAGAAEKVVPKWLDDHERPQVVVLDPPRKGAEPAVLKAILHMQPDRIVYVSCKPSTLARDVKILCEGGYKLVEATPVDMFGHTGHVEAIILMTRSGSGEKK